MLANGITAARMHWAEVNEQVYFNNGSSSGVITQDNQLLPYGTPAAPTLRPSAAARRQQYRVCTLVLADGRETGTSDDMVITIGEGQALQVQRAAKRRRLHHAHYIAPANSQVFGLARGPGAFTWNADPTALGVECTTYGLDPLPAGATVVQIWKRPGLGGAVRPGRPAPRSCSVAPAGLPPVRDLEDYDVRWLAR